jgi:hypothetical protein
MSFLYNLFNRKKKVPELDLTGEKSSILDTEDDCPDDTKDQNKKGLEPDPSVTENQEEGETYEVVEREIHPAKIICPDCGGITLEGLEFCDKCGGELL